MIEVRNVTKSYGSTRAVEGVTFTSPSGTVTGFLGPNGAGKTTTLRILLGLARPDAGSALIDGVRYGELASPRRTGRPPSCPGEPSRRGRHARQRAARRAGQGRGLAGATRWARPSGDPRRFRDRGRPGRRPRGDRAVRTVDRAIHQTAGGTVPPAHRHGGATVRGLLAAEFLKLRTTRTTWALLAATVAVSALAVASAVVVGADSASLDLESDRGVRAVLNVSANGAVFVLALGIIISAGEYRQGTATDTFLTTPRRWRVIAAKLSVAAAAGIAFGALAAGVCIAVANVSYRLEPRLRTSTVPTRRSRSRPLRPLACRGGLMPRGHCRAARAATSR